MSRFFPRAFRGILVLLVAMTATTSYVSSAQEAAEIERERLIADRFLEVLLRRPRPGTSLDRVYGYHIQAGTLDALLSDLESERQEAGVEPGARPMLLGLLLLRRGSDAAAAEALARAETIRTQDAMASYYLGKALLRVGRTEPAAEALQRSIDRQPARNEALPVFTELGRLYQRAQQSDKALEVWDRLEQAFPGDRRVGEQIARTLAEEGQDEAALQRYEKLARQAGGTDDPSVIGFAVAAAELKRKLGRTDDALTDLERIADRLRPGSWLHADVRRRIEAVFLRGGDYSALADYYARQVDQQPDETALRRRLGQTLAKAGRINEAEASLRETVGRAPEDVDARLALVDILKTAAKADQAAEQLEQLVQQDPENPDYLVQLGNTWLDATTSDKSVRQEKAAGAWRRLAQSRPDDPVVTAQVGDLMRRIEHSEEALDLYRRAAELAPDQPQYREYLGEYLHRLDRHDEAVQTWAAIAEPPRDTRDNLIRLAEVLHTFDEAEKGLEAFSKAAELDLTFSQRLRLAELLSRSERYDEALAQLDQAKAVAETPEEREQLLQARIGVYAGSGTLDQQIAEAYQKAEQSGDADDHRRVALMLDAAGRLAEATAAIQAAIRLVPDDASAMAIAAELYRKAARYGDAIEAYRSLARLESRFLPNYLKRIAGLQMQLGQIDEALATALELVQAQPGNPDSYRFHAEQCFRIGRDDEGIDSLRRALRAAPRDRETRQALASALASRFQTDEAIEIYWELLEDSDSLDDQHRWVGLLAPLYERQSDLDRLIGRLELRGRDASDTRSAVLLISAAHRTIGDLGSARQALEPLLAENPRDPELLGEMVTLAEASSEPEAALAYQQQLVALADTPENRNRLLKLMVDSGQTSQAEAALQRLRAMDDPLTMITLIDRVLSSGDRDTAIRFCHAALDQDSGLWEVRIRLAALLLMTDKIDEALQQAQQIESLDLAADTPSEMSKAVQARRPATSITATGSPRPTSSRFNQSQQSYQLAQLFRLGRYGSAQYANVSFSSGRGTAISVLNVDQAKFLATALRLAAAAKQGKLDEFSDSLINDSILESTGDPEQLWAAYHVVTLKEAFGPVQASGTVATSDSQRRMTRWLWRLAEIDRSERGTVIFRLLQMRRQLRNPSQQVAAKPDPPEPLSNEQLALIRDVHGTAGSTLQGTTDIFMASALYEELIAAAMVAEAETFATRFNRSPEKLSDATRSLQFHTASRRVDQVAQILQGIKQSLPTWAPAVSASESQALSSALGGTLSLDDLGIEAKLDAVDLAIAAQAIDRVSSISRRQTSPGNGTLNTYYFVDGQYKSQQIPVPFSQRLVPDALIQQLYTGTRFGIESPERERLLAHLSQDVSVFPEGSQYVQSERKLRSTLDAFARWWIDDPSAAYDRIAAASERHPDDHDLWIERARLAAELNRPQASLDALDAIEPLDQATLRVRELAAMNLATKLGRLERAKTAAQRLFGMRLDSATELALADQLNRLGMQQMASAVLQRSQHRGGQSINDLLQLAQRFLDTGENAAAAEVAYRSLRQLDSGSPSNSEYYRQQAVRVLQRVGRLDGLLEQAQRRVAAAPHSLPLKTQLAELYTAAGRREDAGKIFDQIAELQPNDPRTLWETGKRLSQAGKHDDAVDKFLAAIAKDTSQLRSGYYDFERAVISSKQFDKAYHALAKVDLNQFPAHYLGQAINLYRRGGGEPSEAALAFIDRVLRDAPVDSLGSVLRDVGRDKRVLESEPMAAAVRRIFESDTILQSGNRFWQGNSRSSGGTLHGPLEPCLEIIRAQPEVGRYVNEQLAKRAGDEATSELAKILLLTMDIDSTEAQHLETRLQELLEADKTKIPYGVWWQLGQLLEKKSGCEHLAVVALEHARTYSGLPMSDYTFTLDAKLTDAYVAAGQKEKARLGLLRGYKATDNSEQNQYNPGYGDYADLRSFEGIAEKLTQVDGRLDAIGVYSDALASPERFQRAKRYSGSVDYAERFRQGLAKAIDSLDESDFERFLSPVHEDQADEDQPTADKAETFKPRFDLRPLAPSIETAPERSSIAALVVTTLANADDGREKLSRFQADVARELEQHPTERSLLAMHALIDVALDDESAAELLRQLVETLPGPDAEIGQTEINAILALYSPALLALASENTEVRAQADRLADYLIALAAKVERRDISSVLTLGRFSGRDGQDPAQVAAVMRATLDAVAAPADPPGVVSTATAQECMRVAETAAKAGAWEVAADALRRGLGGGPPLRDLAPGSTTGSAFVLPTQRPSIGFSPDQPKEDLDWVSQRIAALIPAAEETAATELPVRNPEVMYAALKDIVLPPSRPGEIFAYEVNLLTSSGSASFAKPDMHPRNLSRLLAVSAVQSGKAGELAELLATLRTQTKSPHLIDLVRVHLAVAQDDESAAAGALGNFARELGIAVNADKTQATPGDQKPVSAAPRLASPETAAGIALHAVLPVQERWGLTPAVVAIQTHLLAEASRTKTVSDAGDLWGWIIRQLVASPQVDDATAQQAIDHYLASVQLHYSNYSGSYGSDRYNAEMSELTRPALTAGRWEIATSMLRGAVMRSGDYQPTGDRINHLAWQLIGVEAQARYRLLSGVMLGDSGDGPLVTSSNLVMYIDPPAAFGPVFADLKNPHDIPVAARDFPLVDLSLMIAQAAAQCGQTEQLVDRLSRHIKEPGDDVDAMVGLALLADGRREATAAHLARVLQRLQETAPERGVDTPMPIPSALLAAQCLEVEGLKGDASAAWEPLLTHARRRNISLAASLFSRMAIKTGLTEAAGATEGSPLKHFVSVQLPYANVPVSPITEPMYIVRDGILRCASGTGANLLMLKYPLAGEFSFSHRNIHRGWCESHAQFGGTGYLVKPHQSTLTVRGLPSRSSVVLDSEAIKNNKDNRLTLDVTGDKVVMKVNEVEAAVDRRTASMPFLGLLFEHHTISEIADIALQGEPEIARQVNLIDEDLRGWNCSIISGYLMPMLLPLKPDQDPEVVQNQRRQYIENPERFSWFTADGELRNGQRPVSPSDGHQQHLQYQRPLLDGESISYEFFHEADKQEVHPSIGRIGILLRPEGVKLRWLSQRQSLESLDLDPLHEVQPDEVLGNGKPELRPDEWNQLKLTADGDRVVVEVNGKPLCSVVTSIDRRFGLLSEQDRSCRARAISLTGPWPTTLPDNLLEAQ